MSRPPVDLAPADLFLLLLARPRPWWPTDAVEGGRVVAITALERASVEHAARGQHMGAAALTRRRHIVALTLHDEAGPVFATADDAAELSMSGLRRLSDAALVGLERCGPEYGRCDWAEWHKRLIEGACAEPAVAAMVGGCIEEGYRRYYERPDRWFGGALADLTDGQWMAYRAAVSVTNERHTQEA